MKIALGLLACGFLLIAQTPNDSADAHIAAAKAAAGQDFETLFNFQCYGPGPGGQRGGAQRGGGQGAGAQAGRGGQNAGRGGGRGQQGPPDPSTWHAEPVKVFDNLYFFGQSEYAVWAITTSQG